MVSPRSIEQDQPPNTGVIRAQLREILAQCLQLPPDEIGGSVPFMDLGASSLALVDAFRAIHRTFGVRPAIRRVFDEYDTLDTLAGYIRELQASATSSSPPSPADSPAPAALATLPLAASQQHVWFLARYSEGAMLAHVHRLVWHLDGPVDPAGLERALQQVRDRHEGLRVTFEVAEDQQRINEGQGPILELHEFPSESPAEQQRAVAAWLAEEARRPFHLTGVLWRVSLLRLAPRRHLLVISAHGLIADRAALHTLTAEVGAMYSAGLAGTGADLAAPMSLPDYARLLETQAAGADYREAATYWAAQYADGVPHVNLPLWQSRPPVKQYQGARLVVPLPDTLSRRLSEWNTARKSTPYVTLLSAFQVWLHRLSGQRDVVVGVFGQGAPWLPSDTPLVAHTANPLPFRMAIGEETSFAGHTQSVQQALLAAFDHQHYPFAAIVRDVRPERDQSRSAMFTVALDWEPERPPPVFGGLTASRVTPPVAYVPYDLLLTVVQVNGRTQLQCDYSTELFDAATIRRWMISFRTLLAAGLASDDPIDRLPLLSPDEEHQVLVEWNRTGHEYPADRCLHELIEAQAARAPDAVAVIGDDATMGYAELEQRANQLARHLRRLGVGAGTFVGIGVSRTTRMLMGLLGILKAGGAYLPLDPAYPEDRLRFMLADARAGLLLTETRHRARFAGFAGTVICVDDLQEVWEGESTSGLPRLAGPADPAYLIYTSGSTGRPKGVPIVHRSLVNLATYLSVQLSLTPRDVTLATTTLSFDIAVTELFLPLIAGGTVVLVPRNEATDAMGLMAKLRAHGVTLMQATPSHWQGLLNAGWTGTPDLKIVCCGEPLKRELVEPLERCGRAVWNWYGPTETTIYSTGGRVSAADETVTIGRPIANTEVFVLDEGGQPVPIGVPGELFIGGDGLSPGYWQRPELTRQRFVDNPWPHSRCRVLYRTGDRVRYRPTGEIEFVGRLDDQVKVKGFRIEPGEIETILHRHPLVERSAVVAHDDAGGLKLLVAYIVSARGAAPTPADLRTFLGERVPDYMIPSAFVLLEALPLTPGGKVDRLALPAPQGADRMASPAVHAAPRDSTEVALCEIWRELLQLDRIGIHDSFFDLGGHSLLLAPLVLKLRDRFQLRVGMREVFDRPTVAELAQMIAGLRSDQVGELRRPAPAQAGASARTRFDFLRQEAHLGPSIQPADPAGEWTPIDHLFMTGATGFVGAYILHFLLEQTSVTVHCLVRAADRESGAARIRQHCERLGLWRESFAPRIVPVPGDLSRPNLGMDEATYARLARTADAVLHSAALVNFVYPYQALRPVNVDGVRAIISFACSARVKPVHYLSTTAVWPMGAQRTFREDSDLDHDLLLNLAYDETKWVAEKMLGQAAARGIPVAVYRPGEVSGDSRTGFGDVSHLATAFVKGSLQAGVFPALGRFDAAPVDYVAQALIALMMRRESLGRTFHLCNPYPLQAQEAYEWLRGRGYDFEVVPFAEWRQRILADDRLAENALYPFAPILEEFSDHSMQLPIWDTTETRRALAGSGVECAPLDEHLLATYVDYYVAAGYLPTPEQLRQTRRPATVATS